MIQTAIIFLCLLGLKVSVRGEYQFSKEEIYSGPPDFIKIPQEDLDTLFKGLDRNNDGKLDSADLNTVFNNPRAAGDVDKFIDEAGTGDHNKEVDQTEFNKFMSEQSAVWAVAGCKFFKASSHSVKLQCYKDEFVAYVHAMMPFDEVVTLFKAFDTNGNGEITKEDIMEKLKIKGQLPNKEDRDDVVNNLFDEWGHDDQKSTFGEFKSYVRQVEVMVEMKPCKHRVSCSKNMLIKYSTFSVTENDIHNLFLLLDKNHDGQLDESDLRGYTLNPAAFFAVVDSQTDNDQTVNFEEFRFFLKRILIKNLLEEYCATIYNGNMQQNCYKEHLFGLLRFAYKYAKMNIPHRNILYMFEQLDTDGSGEIGEKDLATYESNEELRGKILAEIDTSLKNETINLEEFAYFLSYPSTIYAMSKCLYETVDKENECFAKSFVDFTAHMMLASQIEEFFKSYDTQGRQKMTKAEVDAVLPPGDTHDEDVENFINELALGDDVVTLFEFASYVRHLDMREDFDKCGSVKDKQDKLLDYIRDRLTEYDIEKVFEKFDTDQDLEIELEDLKRSGKSEEDCQKFLKAIDSDDEGEDINFTEFRHYLLLTEHRNMLETECTAPLLKQEEEISCYVEKIWTMVSK